MPKSQVRQAIANYLDPFRSSIAYLSTVYQALPKVANEDGLFKLQPAGQGTGAEIFLFIEDQQEWRDSDGGPHDGIKLRSYTVSMLCIFKSDLPSTTEGQVQFDEFIDSLTAYIQADRNAGDPSVVWQWGEGDTKGGVDLRFQYPIPKTLSGGVVIYQAVGRVMAIETLFT